MRLIDADFAKERIKNSDLPNYWKNALISCLSSIPTINLTANDPLTLEELRQMNGKRVWVECERSYGKVFVNGDRVHVSTFESLYTRPEEYIMYRRKPEEGAT